jgi:hypothetical protein
MYMQQQLFSENIILQIFSTIVNSRTLHSFYALLYCFLHRQMGDHSLSLPSHERPSSPPPDLSCHQRIHHSHRPPLNKSVSPPIYSGAHIHSSRTGGRHYRLILQPSAGTPFKSGTRIQSSNALLTSEPRYLHFRYVLYGTSPCSIVELNNTMRHMGVW